MRKAILLTMSMLLVTTLALADHTEAVFVTKGGDSFMLVLDGRRMTPRPVTQLRLDQVDAGSHLVEVTLFRGSYSETIRDQIVLRPGTISQFAVKVNNRHGYGVIRLTKEAPIYRGWAFQDRDWYSCSTDWDHDDYWDDDYRGGGRGHYGRGKGKGHGNGWGPGGRPANDPSWGRGKGDHHGGGHGDYHGGGYGGSYGGGMQCSHACHFEINYLMLRLDRAYFDEDKLNIARQMTYGQMLLTRDVIAIMERLAFEDNRVDFAIYAYPLVCDKQNFELVKTALRFRSSHARVEGRLHCW